MFISRKYGSSPSVFLLQSFFLSLWWCTCSLSHLLAPAWISSIDMAPGHVSWTCPSAGEVDQDFYPFCATYTVSQVYQHMCFLVRLISHWRFLASNWRDASKNRLHWDVYTVHPVVTNSKFMAIDEESNTVNPWRFKDATYRVRSSWIQVRGLNTIHSTRGWVVLITKSLESTKIK